MIATIEVSRETADRWQKALCRTAPVRRAKHDAVLETLTAKFGDGFEADIKLCNGDGPYIDPVLFDEGGHEVVALQDQSERLEGEYAFDDGHVVVVKIKEHTITSIRDELRRLNCNSTLEAFRVEINREAIHLLSLEPRPWTNKRRDAAQDRAELFFAQEIGEALDQPPGALPLEPDDIFHQRRKPVVWAVATVIRRERAWQHVLVDIDKRDNKETT